MASYIDAAALVTIGTALVIYQQSLDISAAEIGVLSGTVTLGVAAGSLVGGRLGDRFGRRSVFIATMAIVMLGSALLTFGTTFPVLLVGVVVIGVATGSDLPVSLATISEAATDKNRGALIGMSSVLWVVGIVAVMIIAALVGDSGHIGGQILFAHVGVVAALVLVARLFVPESRSWVNAKAARTGVGAEAKIGFRALVARGYRGPLIALLLFYTLTNVAANTNGQFNTFIAVNHAGLSVAIAAQIGLVTLPVAVLAGLLFMRVVDTRFRMLFYAIGALCFVAAYAVPTVFGFSAVTIIAMGVLSGIGTSLAFEGIMKVWTQESFPTMARATAQGAIIAVARVVSALVAFVTPLLLSAGPQVMYATLTVLVAGGTLIGWLGFRRPRLTEFEMDKLGEAEAPVATEAQASAYLSGHRSR